MLIFLLHSSSPSFDIYVFLIVFGTGSTSYKNIRQILDVELKTKSSPIVIYRLPVTTVDYSFFMTTGEKKYYYICSFASMTMKQVVLLH